MLDLSCAEWRTSSHSGSGNNCVQVARVGRFIVFRDSKNIDGGVVTLPASDARSVVRKAVQR